MRRKASGEARAPAGLRMPPTSTLRLSELNMAPYNPRVMPPETMRALKASLLKHGMVLNLVVQARSPKYGERVLIGGHQRVVAMRQLCAEKGWPEPADVACVVLDVGDAEAKQLNVALNNIEGEFDPFKLGTLFSDIRLQMTEDDVLATGFLRENIDELVQLALEPSVQAAMLEDGVGDLGGFATSITLSVEFSTAAKRDEAKAIAKQLATDRGRKAGDALLDLLKADRAARGKGRRTRAA